MIKAIAKAPIWLYQKAVSPVLPKSCRYSPTCSSYTIEAIDKYGAVKGLWLGLKRLSRCHPWSRYDHHDPVP